MVIGCVLATVALPAQDAAPGSQATFRARTDAVTVTVSVKQRGRPVTGLTAADFALTDNGIGQTIEAFSLERAPLDVTLVIPSYRAANRDVRAAHASALASASVVGQSLLPQDRLRVVRVGVEISGTLRRPEDALRDEMYSGSSLVDGLFYAMAWPVDPDRRHLAVAFTDGFDTYSALELDALPRLAASSDAVLHVVFWGNPADAPVNGITSAGGATYTTNSPFVAEWEASREVVSEAARRTGGAVHRMSSAERDLAAVIEDFRTNYVLQYTPRGRPAPGWHELRVRVTRPGRFDVRARQGYEVRRD